MNTISKKGLNISIEKISASLTLNDLIVKDETFISLRIMENWLKTRKNDAITINPFTNTFSGFRAVFSGPAGTGKTFAASLLGKETGYDVYCIDISSVISKYIGETEKNLEILFSKAEVSDIILVFDEADALFGTRTGIQDSHDRYSSVEIPRLIEQIEAFKGILILAFNKQFNMNSPFFKRFNLVVEFEKPNRSQRLKLWRKYLPMPVQQEMGFDVDEIARKYKLTGGEIVRVIHTTAKNNPAGFSKALLINELHGMTK